MILGLFYLIYKRIKALNDRRTLVFYKDGTHAIKNFKVKDGKLQIRPSALIGGDTKAWTPNVTSDNVIPAKKSFIAMVNPFGFKQKDLFLAVEDSQELVSLRGLKSAKVKEGIDSSLLLKQWTKPEVAQFIKKALAKGTVQRKIFSDSQFYMFFGVLVLNSVMLILVVRAMGIL
jgi:hypothetical protein